ncbi:hypothetical protein BN2537_4827 [Streptomyces venezuelae]|nr:hypothetical protein BN2537_4827 [Streptomyces venezuelae]
MRPLVVGPVARGCAEGGWITHCFLWGTEGGMWRATYRA